MAVPKKKASKARTRRRYHANSVLTCPELYRDQESGALVRRHYVNEVNGAYRGRLIVTSRPDPKPKKAKQSAR